MNLNLLLENLTNPALLFFILGIFSTVIKSDLKIPSNSSKFISIYLLFSIGFKAGQELTHESLNFDILLIMISGVFISLAIPVYTFFIMKLRFNAYDSAALAASYGSVSVVTFVTAYSFLEMKDLEMSGYMVVVMALMESPSIIIGLLLFTLFQNLEEEKLNKRTAFKHALTNGSVVLILGSLLIGYLADAKQAEGIKPFTNDIFKGFLAVFLLDMGIESGKKLKSFFSYGWFPIVAAIILPIFNGCLVAYSSSIISDNISDRFIISILAASASYIAVPAAMKMTLPKANTGLLLPMALAITFPINITVGMPLFFQIVSH